MRFCSNCGEAIDKNSKVCSKCGKKHKKEKNMLLYFLSMILIFIIFDLVAQRIYSEVYFVIRDSKYGVEIVLEAIWAFVCFGMMLIAGNKYIFDRKKMNFFDSIKLAVPPMVIAVVSFMTSFSSAYSYSSIDVFGVAIYAICIGITEEFMCRGWVLTEFLERYGYDLKHVRLSIICSALVFSCMHLTNILTGQTVFDTILQVIQTLGIGYLLGAVFFRTRNIWSVVFVHAFYDFSLMLEEIGPYSSCQVTNTTTFMNVCSIVTSFLLCFIYILFGEMNLRKEVSVGLLPRKVDLKQSDIKESRKIYKYLCAGVVLVFIMLYIVALNTPEAKKVCVKYDTKEITDYYITTYNSDSYSVDYEDSSFTLYTNDNSLYIENNNSKKDFELLNDVDEFEVIKNNDYFVIGIYNSNDSSIIYRKIMYSEIRNDDSFAEKILEGSKEYIVPSLTSFDSISFDEYGERYLSFTSGDIYLGMIDTDYNLYELVSE